MIRDLRHSFKYILLFSAALAAVSCLTTTEKKIMDPPWKPSAESVEASASNKPPVGQVAPVYFSKEAVPEIDGNFAEWEGLKGVNARVMVYGGLYNAENTSGHFILRTDGPNLYLFADIGDESANANSLPAAQAWRGDSVEFFFGTETLYHTFYKNSDRRVRIIPKNRTNKSAFDLSFNDVSNSGGDVKAAIVFSGSGYRVEAKIPLALMNAKALKIGQKLRCEFQINDADNGKERARLVHWMSEKDVSYMDASTWGDGRVVPLSGGDAQAGKK
jgi:hypothetical protein